MKKGLILGLVLALAVSMSAVSLSPRELRVPTDFPTIQAAVDAARSGDKIIVEQGTYEPFTVEGKSLTIQGEGVVSVVGKKQVVTAFEGETTAIVFVKDASLTLKKLSLRGREEDPPTYGLIVQESEVEFQGTIYTNNRLAGAASKVWSEAEEEKNAILKLNNSELKASKIGAEVAGDAGIDVTWSFFRDMEMSHISVYQNATATVAGSQFHESGFFWGIIVEEYGQIEVKGSTFMGGGICFLGNSEGVIANNSFITGAAVGVIHDAKAEILNNTFRQGTAVIRLSHNAEAKIEGNTIADTLYGITFIHSAKAELSNNTILDSAVGLLAVDSTIATIQGGTIQGNAVGILVRDDAELAVHQSNIASNSVGVDATHANKAVDATNNWWGNRSGPSGEGPGSGDAVSENVLFSPWLMQPVP